MEIIDDTKETTNKNNYIIETFKKFLLIVQPSESDIILLDKIKIIFYIYSNRLLESYINDNLKMKDAKKINRNINYIKKSFINNKNIGNNRYKSFPNLEGSSDNRFMLIIIFCFTIFREVLINKNKKNSLDIKNLILVKLNNLISTMSILIGKLYIGKNIDEDKFETYLKYLIILSISCKINEKPNKNDKIVNMMFFKECFNIIRLIYNKIYEFHNEFTERQEKLINNIILFVHNYTIDYSNEKPISIINKSFLSYNDYYTSSLIDLILIISKMKNNEIINNFIGLLTNIYAFSFRYDNMMSQIIKILEPLLININIKKLEEINAELIVSSFPLKLLNGLIQKENIILKNDPTLLKNGFYLGNKVCGLSSEINNIGDDFLLIFGFSLHEINNEINNIKQWTLIHFRNKKEKDKENESQLKLWLSRIDNSNDKYNLLISIKNKIYQTNIIIISNKTYIFSFHFKSKKLKICYTFSSETDPSFIIENNEISIQNFNTENTTIYIGCDINTPINFTRESNTFTGFIGPIIIINQKKLSKKNPEEIAKLILSLKGDYASCILMSLENLEYKPCLINNEKKYDFKNQKKNKVIHDKIIELNENMNDLKFVESIKAIISPHSFRLVEYKDEIDYLNLYNNYDLYENSKKENILLSQNYLDLRQTKSSSLKEKMITIFTSFFNNRFHVFENRKTLEEFIKYDGIHYLCLLLEYYYQIICHIEENNIIKDQKVDIYKNIEINIIELIMFFKDNIINEQYCEFFIKEINHFFYQMTITLKKFMTYNFMNIVIFDIIKDLIEQFINFVNNNINKSNNYRNEFIKIRNNLLDLLYKITIFFYDDNIFIKINRYIEIIKEFLRNNYLNDSFSIESMNNLLYLSTFIFDNDKSFKINKEMLKSLQLKYSELLIQYLKFSYSYISSKNDDNIPCNKRKSSNFTNSNKNKNKIIEEKENENKYLNFFLESLMQKSKNYPYIFSNLLNILYKSELIDQIPLVYMEQIQAILFQNYKSIDENRESQIICESSLKILSAYCLKNPEKEKILYSFLSRLPFNMGFFKSIISSLRFIKNIEYFSGNNKDNKNADNINNNKHSIKINESFYYSKKEDNKPIQFDLFPLKNLDFSLSKSLQGDILIKLLQVSISMLFSQKESLIIYKKITEKDAQEIYDILKQNIDVIFQQDTSSFIYKEVFSSKKEIMPHLFFFKWKLSNNENKKILIDDIKHYHEKLFNNHNFPFIFKFILLIYSKKENQSNENESDNIDNTDNEDLLLDLLSFVSDRLENYFNDYEDKKKFDVTDYSYISNLINILILINKILIENEFLLENEKFLKIFFEVVKLLKKTGLLYSNYCFEIEQKCGKIIGEICYDIFIILLNNSFNNKEYLKNFIETFFTENKQLKIHYSIFYFIDLNKEDLLKKDEKLLTELKKYIKEYKSLKYIHNHIFVINKEKINIFGKIIRQLEDVNLTIFILDKTYLYYKSVTNKELSNFLVKFIMPIIARNISLLWTQNNPFYGQKICKRFPLYLETKIFFEAHCIQMPNNFDIYMKFFKEDIPTKIKEEKQLSLSNCYASRLLSRKEKIFDNIIENEPIIYDFRKMSTLSEPKINPHNNSFFYMDSNNWFFKFENVEKKDIIYNPKNYLMKEIFSLTFKDIFFKDKVFQKIKSAFLCRFRKNKTLIIRTKQLSYPIKQKNFSNSLEPKTFLRRDYNIYNTDYFDVSHRYINKNLIKENDKKNLFFFRHEYYSKNIVERERLFECELVTTQFTYFGKIYFGDGFLSFESQKFYTDECSSIDKYNFDKYVFSVRDQYNKTSKKKKFLIFYRDIKEVIRRRTLYMKQSIEIFNKNGKSFFFNFFKTNICDIVFNILIDVKDDLLTKNKKQFSILSNDYKLLLKEKLNAFKYGEITNYNYLLYLNKLSSRTYNDLAQYPVFPWLVIKINKLNDLTDNVGNIILKNNMINEKEENKENNDIRDMNYPISMQSPEKREEQINKYLDDNSKFRCHMGTHYSTSSYIYYYLMRINPYGENLIKLQNYQQENPNRMFLSFKETQIILNSSTDNRELIPDIYCYIDYFCNLNCSFFGIRANLNLVDDLFIIDQNIPKEENLNLISSFIESLYRHKKLLNDVTTSKKLDKWVDIIFGKRQLPLDDENIAYSCNIFQKTAYEQKMNLEKKKAKYESKKISEKDLIKKMKFKINIIMDFGMCPCQILKETNSYEGSQNIIKNQNTKTKKVGNFYYFTKINNNEYLSISESDNKGTSITRSVYYYENKEGKVYNIYPCGNFENDISHIYINIDNSFIPLYKPNYAISEITIYDEINQKNEIFILTCRFLGNYFKVQNNDKILMILCEDFVTTIVSRNSEKNDSIFFTGLKNGKLIEWKIKKNEVIVYIKKKAQTISSFTIKEKKHVYAHKSSITSIEVNNSKQIIASAGEDKFIYIRKLYDFELLTSIDLTYTFLNPIISKSPNIFPSLIKISDLNCIYVILYNYTLHKTIIRGYTLNGLFFAQTDEYNTGRGNNDLSYNNISFNKNWNLIVGLYNFNEILLLNSFNLKVRCQHRIVEDDKNKHYGSKWLEYDTASREFIILYDNEYQIITLSEEKQNMFDS